MTATQRSRSPLGQASRADDSPRRILIGTDTYPPDVNGCGYFTHRLATGLAARGNDVHVVCVSADGPPRIEYRDGVTLHRLRSASVLVHPSMRVAVPLGVTGHVARLIDRLAPHVVHAQSHFTISRAAIRCAKRSGTPVVLTNHFMPDNLFAHAYVPERLHRVVGSAAWRDMVAVAHEADYVTTPTARAAELLAGKGYTRPIEAVSCGIDLQRFHPRPAERRTARAHFGLPDRPTMLFVGRLDVEKRIDELIRALPRVLNRQDVQLALAGTGQREGELRRLADDLGVADRVHFLGFVPDSDLPLTYVAADLFAIGSVAELQSIATLEAMSTGLPVVAADALALPHLVRPERNGYLYPPGDISVLTERIVAVLESAERRAAMGTASREIAAQHDHERSLDRFEEIYAEVRPGRSGSPARRRTVVGLPQARVRTVKAA
ncbi:glycosyltransferase [Marinactinospora rubrisoli]|uniref:Glycosyltransferase n=1 Tax=Marinactinospora rubrisoli TaxID=2715399 RepID=A0ABW2KI92_9ACTN